MTEYTGIINLLKPAGMTSHDGVYFLRKLTGIKRIGHTGTLDPMATGVLPICIGSATRVMDYLDLDEKEYRCEMILGLETDTGDIWGTVLNESRDKTAEINEYDIVKAFTTSIGEIYQIPPSYSSVRIKGMHLYEYARKGREISAPPRPVIIRNIELVTFDRRNNRVLFDVKCSKGTYIRSICQETGKILGCGGTMSFLSRTASGDFRIENSVTLEELADDWDKHLLPPEFPLKKFGELLIPPEREKWFLNGGHLRTDEVKIIRKPSIKAIPGHIKTREGLDRAYSVYCGERFLGVAIYNKDKKQFIVDKVFSK